MSESGSYGSCSSLNELLNNLDELDEEFQIQSVDSVIIAPPDTFGDINSEMGQKDSKEYSETKIEEDNRLDDSDLDSKSVVKSVEVNHKLEKVCSLKENLDEDTFVEPAGINNILSGNSKTIATPQTKINDNEQTEIQHLHILTNTSLANHLEIQQTEHNNQNGKLSNSDSIPNKTNSIQKTINESDSENYNFNQVNSLNNVQDENKSSVKVGEHLIEQGDCVLRPKTNFVIVDGCTVEETYDDSPEVRPFSESDTIYNFLGVSNADAEARLLARRAARAEARDIRMKELERQQREQEENADRQFDMLAEPIVRRPAPGTSTSRYMSSRRSSEDSLEDTGSLRDLRHELKEVEEKFRKAMIANAQLDNDKAAQTYQIELLKDRLEELEEEHSQLKREHRDKCRDFDQLKRLTGRLKEDLTILKSELEERDRLIAEKGLVIVGVEDSNSIEQIEGLTNGTSTPRRALVSAENAHLLEHAGEGSLDVRLARFAKERGELQDQISHLKIELEEEKSRRRKHSSGSILNGPSSDSDYDAADIQREASKQLAEFKFRAQKAEQDVVTLQTTCARLESQVIRYKSASEVSEKSEEALKVEKRKLQREAREAQSRADELETSNTHLLKRLDKLKNAKSALLKEL